MRNFIVCGYYTAPYYKPVAEKYLIPSVNKLSLDNYIIEVPSQGDWWKNILYKPTFILDCLNKFKDKNIVYVDVDGKINKYPVLFDEITENIGVHYLDWKLQYNKFLSSRRQGLELLSGTMFFNNNINIVKLVETWANICNGAPKGRKEQVILEALLNNTPDITVNKLPREYCYIVTQPNGTEAEVPIKDPIISHYQASRQLRST